MLAKDILSSMSSLQVDYMKSIGGTTPHTTCTLSSESSLHYFASQRHCCVQQQRGLLSTSPNELDKGTLSLSGWATLRAQHRHGIGAVLASHSGFIKNNNNNHEDDDDDVPQRGAREEVRWDEAARLAWLMHYYFVTGRRCVK